MTRLLYTFLTFISLVVPAADVYRGESFTITVQSESPITMQLDPRFDVLNYPSHVITWAGGGMLRLSLRVRADARPGLAWFEVNNVARAVRICCESAPYAISHTYLPVLRR